MEAKTNSPFHPPQMIDIACFISLLFFAAALPFSIAAGTVFLIVFLTVGVVKWARSPRGGEFCLTPGEKILLFYIGWVAVGCFFHGAIFQNLLDMRTHYMVLLLFIIPRVLTTVSQVQRVIGAFIVSSALTALLGIFQFFSTDVLLLGRPAGTRSNPLTFAEGLLMALAMAFPQLKRSLSPRSLFRWGTAIALFFGIIAASCRGPWLALIGLLMGFEWMKKKFFFITLVFLVGVSVFSVTQRSYLANRYRSIVSTTDNSNVERFYIWGVASRMVREKPITGYGSKSLNIKKGYAAVQSRMGGLPQKNYAEMHNVYLQILVQHGFPGLILFVLFFWQLHRLCIAEKANDMGQGVWLAMVGFLLAGLTESTFNDSEIVMSLFLLIGLLSAAQAIHWKEVHLK